MQCLNGLWGALQRRCNATSLRQITISINNYESSNVEKKIFIPYNRRDFVVLIIGRQRAELFEQW